MQAQVNQRSSRVQIKADEISRLKKKQTPLPIFAKNNYFYKNPRSINEPTIR